jgi:hypothetical protein
MVDGVSRLVVSAFLIGVLGGPVWVAAAGGEQVIPVEPAVEQRVEAVGGAGEQRVEALSAEQAEQAVNGATPRSGTQRAASTAGKVALGFVAVVVSIASMAASLLFF